MHTCILTEYVYAQKAKASTIGVQAFASAVQTKLLGLSSVWPVAQLGEPLFSLGEAAFLKRTSKLLAVGNRQHASAAARAEAIALIVGPGKQIHRPPEGVPLLAYFKPGTTFIDTAQHANGLKGAVASMKKRHAAAMKAARTPSPHSGRPRKQPRTTTPATAPAPAPATTTPAPEEPRPRPTATEAPAEQPRCEEQQQQRREPLSPLAAQRTRAAPARLSPGEDCARRDHFTALPAFAPKVAGARPLGAAADAEPRARSALSCPGLMRFGKGAGALPVLTMVGARHAMVAGRAPQNKVPLQAVIWHTTLLHEVPKADEIFSQPWTRDCVMRLSVLDRKASAILFLANYEASNGWYGLHVAHRGRRCRASARRPRRRGGAWRRAAG